MLCCQREEYPAQIVSHGMEEPISETQRQHKVSEKVTIQSHLLLVGYLQQQMHLWNPIKTTDNAILLPSLKHTAEDAPM